MSGNDVDIGVDILIRAATGDEFADATERSFDNDSGRFADPHPDALDPARNAALATAIDPLIERVARA